MQEIQTLIPKSPPLSPDAESIKCASDILASLESGEKIANGMLPAGDQTDGQHELSHRDLDFLPTKEGATDLEKGNCVLVCFALPVTATRVAPRTVVYSVC